MESSKQPAAIEQLLSPQEVSEITGLSPGTLALWRSTGRVDLPYCKLGRSVRYRRDDLEAFLENSRKEHTSAPEPGEA